MLQDTLGGHIDLFFATPQQVVGQFASGEVKVFGITSKETSPQFPGVPSFVAAYGPKLNIDFWQIMLAPAGTPKPIVDALDGALQEALDDPEILEDLGRQRHGALSQGRSARPPAQRPISRARSRAGARSCATTRSRRRRIRVTLLLKALATERHERANSPDFSAVRLLHEPVVAHSQSMDTATYFKYTLRGSGALWLRRAVVEYRSSGAL